MNKEQFDRETRYGAAMVLASEMLSRGIIDDKDHDTIETIFRLKYCPLIGGLQAKKALTSGRFRANMSHAANAANITERKVFS